MEKNQLIRMNDSIYRVLAVTESKAYVLDCGQCKMPKWMDRCLLEDAVDVSEAVMLEELHLKKVPEEELSAEQLRRARERYGMICGILPFLDDDKMRNTAIERIAEQRGISRRTITTYLSSFLATMDISALAGLGKEKEEKGLTQDQKNMRWALNKFYYTRHGNTIPDAYVMMLKEKYTDGEGKLLSEHPSIYQFRYFFKKTRKKQTEIISREGIKEYQLNHRPLLGEDTRDFAPGVGTGMLDGTVCDIYLVDGAGKLIGRPVLVACVDAYSSMCCGYALLWEGGVYSCRELMLNVVTDKVEWCRKHGIIINEDDWPCKVFPGTIVTDRGSEYISANFEQISELGCQLISLPSFSANMKGPVEKLFDLVQDSFKPYLKGKGVIEPDFQKRGIRDYRKDACLTMEQFEQIVIRCILYYNNSRILESFPFSEEMMEGIVAPHAADIWKYGCEQVGANLISVSAERLIMTLLPRTEGKFSRYGLRVNKMRYHAEGYTEEYLRGGKVMVAYNPDDVSNVWLLQDGEYIKFALIERKYSGKSLEEVQHLQNSRKTYCRSYMEDNLQAKVELAKHIEAIVDQTKYSSDTDIKGVRKRRKKAVADRHRDLVKEVKSDAEE